MIAARPVIERFDEKWIPEPNSGCWLWIAARIVSGYGKFAKRKGKIVFAHRISYELRRGPIPPGLNIDHLCRNVACVNPWHMEPVTQRQNVLRGVGFAAIYAAQTHCLRGHPFDAGNTRFVVRTGKNPGPRRICRACDRLRNESGAGCAEERSKRA